MIFDARLVKEYDAVIDKIFEIICNDWDPLDLSSMESSDLWKEQEYVQYLGSVVKILLSDKDAHSVESSLIDIVAEIYQCKAEEVIRFPKVSKKLLELRNDLKKLHILLPKDGRGMINVSEIRRVESLNRELDEYLRIGEELSKEKNPGGD